MLVQPWVRFPHFKLHCKVSSPLFLIRFASPVYILPRKQASRSPHNNERFSLPQLYSKSEHILVRKVRPVRAKRVVWVDNFSSMF